MSTCNVSNANFLYSIEFLLERTNDNGETITFLSFI